MRFGKHGLPLIGGGDWNDGMDKVGIEGKGESVWLGWFLISSLKSLSLFVKRKATMKMLMHLERL